MQRESATQPPSRSGRLHTFVGAALVMSVLLIWSVATARYGGPDEPAHVLRSAAVASGDILGSPVAGLDPGYRRTVVAAALTTGDPTCYRHDDDIPATCAHADSTANGMAAAASSAGTYPPIYYALVGIPVRAFGDVADAAWYRYVAAFWCALVLMIAAVRARRIGVDLLIVCVTPATWFLFGVVNPNSLEVALAVLSWVGVERIRVQHRRLSTSDLAWVAVPISIAIVLRPVAAMAWFAIAGASLLIIAGRSTSITPPSRRAWSVFVGVPLAAIATVIGWNLWAAVDISDQRTAESVSVSAAIRRSLDESTETWREMVGSLGWLEFSAPWLAHVAWWCVLVAAAMNALRPGIENQPGLRRSWLWVLAVTAVGPILFEVMFASSIGFIWQGRYSIPSGLGLTILGLTAWRRRLSLRARTTVGAIGAAAQVITLWTVLQRYSVGADGSWWLRGAWSPPAPAMVLLTLDAIAMTGLVLLARSSESVESTESVVSTGAAGSTDSAASVTSTDSAGGGRSDLAAHHVQR